jgi:hypothetical protein
MPSREDHKGHVVALGGGIIIIIIIIIIEQGSAEHL